MHAEKTNAQMIQFFFKNVCSIGDTYQILDVYSQILKIMKVVFLMMIKMSQSMTQPTKCTVCPAKTQISLRKFDQGLRCALNG